MEMRTVPATDDNDNNERGKGWGWRFTRLKHAIPIYALVGDKLNMQSGPVIV